MSIYANPLLLGCAWCGFAFLRLIGIDGSFVVAVLICNNVIRVGFLWILAGMFTVMGCLSGPTWKTYVFNQFKNGLHVVCDKYFTVPSYILISNELI